MKSNGERQHVADEKSLNGTKGMRNAPPKLRKNKRLEKRWGPHYYASVKEAVFVLRANPHMPAEPPLSIREEADDCQSLYVCHECKDCFHFSSSLEAHKSRRSWILGYWCHNCFFIDCSHVQRSQPPCFDCQGINRQRTMFLRAKGLRKGRKIGSIKIFYNQCQFFSHLRNHNTTTVDMADVMLMPLPVDADKECYSELEQLCETIMECMFLTRKHIMDWLKSQQLGNKWWSSLRSNLENKEGPLAQLLAGTGLRRGGKKSVKHPVKSQKILNNGIASVGAASPGSSSVTYPSSSDTQSSISETIESVIAQSTSDETAPTTKAKNPVMPPLTSITYINPLEPIEDDDNPCSTADIAFVDCGPAARTYPPDVAIVLPPKDKFSINPNGSTSCSSVVNVVPVVADSHPPLRASRTPIILKQRPADKVLHTGTSTITASPVSPRPFEPKISVKKFANERLKTVCPPINCQKSYSRLNNQKPQPLRKLAPAASVQIASGKTSLPSVLEIARVVETSKKSGAQTSLSTLGPKIVTVQSPRSTQLSQIISQLPPDVINGKKIVFIGQDAERFTILPKNDTITSNLGIIKIPSETDKANIDIVPTHPAKIAPIVVSNASNSQPEVSQNSPLPDKTKAKIQPVFLDGKVIYQNGKKFIIRHARKPVPESSICTNINNLKLQTIPKHISLSSFLSKSRIPVTSGSPIVAKSADTGANELVSLSAPTTLTSSSTSPSSSLPSPSLSPSLSISENPVGLQSKAERKRKRKRAENLERLVSSSHSTESQLMTASSLCKSRVREADAVEAVEYFFIQKNEAGKSYVDLSKGRVSSSQTFPNFKHLMLQKSRHLGIGRIKQQIEHLMEVNAEYSKMLGVTTDARISENLNAIRDLEDALEEEPVCLDQDRNIHQGSSADDMDEVWLNLTETKKSPFTCSTCNKSIAESRILDCSRKSVESPSCHNCNNYMCHICDVFQGHMARFRAHLNFHAKKPPFMCPECFRKFPTFERLETHIWTICFHLLARRWFKCRMCEVEGFVSMESLTKHFILAHSRLKIACPECGILSQSRTVFQKHCEEDHPKATNQLKPVNLIVCDVANCVVRVEDYRSHMEHHMVATNMLYYKCTYCSFIIPAMKRSREQIRCHLYNKHIDKLVELGFENLHLANLKLSMTSEDNLQDDCNTNLNYVSISNLESEQKNQREEVIESEQGPSLSESKEKNTGTSNNAVDNSQADSQLSADYLNAKLTKQTLKDGVECSVWSINLGHTESPESMDLRPESLQIMTTIQEDGHTQNNVITEYSSSPKIFDVRSVTPDSYAEFGGVTKEEVDVSTEISKKEVLDNCLQMNVLENRNHIVVSENGARDSFLIKMGEQLLPMKLPQVILINEAQTDVNLAEMLQSTWITSNTFVKLSNLTSSDANAVTELTDKSPEVSDTKESADETVPEQHEKTTIGSTSFRKLPASASSKKQTLPSSVLKSKNSSIEIIKTTITEPNNGVSESYGQVVGVSQISTNTSGSSEEKPSDLLLYDVSKPPPLARIPQHLLEESQVAICKNEVEEEEEVQEIKEVTTPKSTMKTRQRPKRPWRIALNGPICSSEIIDYRCHLCGDFINTSWSVLRNHFSSKHSQDYKLAVITPRLLRMSGDFISDGYKEVLGSKKRKSDGIVSSSKRRRRWNPRKHTETHSLGSGLCVQQESVQDGEGNFVCKKCDQQCDDISSLRTHIGTHHRIKDHYLVCLECGENFVVEPSLQMHLKAFHRIQDPCAYLAQNTAYAKKFTEIVEEESSTGIANQCHVCMAVFEDKLAVDKHLRVHGMAFLNRKRIEAQIAARNPEKKSKVDDKPDRSLVNATQKNEKLDSHKLGKIESVNGTVRES